MWRRSLVRPSVCLSVCDAVQETKRFAGCRRIRHGMILRNRCSFECCANGLNFADLSTLQCRRPHAVTPLGNCDFFEMGCNGYKGNLRTYFFIFSIYFTRGRERARARNVLSDREFSDRAMHRKLSCTERRK